MLSGRLEVVTLADILQLLAAGSHSGILSLEQAEPPEWAEIELLEGMVIRAELSSTPEALGALLLRREAIEAAALGKALERQSAAAPWRPLGSVLLEMHAVEPGALATALTEQIEHTLSRALTWTEGVFRFRVREEGLTEAADEVRVQLDSRQLLIAAAHRADESSRWS